MADLTDLREGRWGISRILEPEPLAFTTAAMVQRLGACSAHYPPLNATKTGYTLPFAVVHFPDGVTGTPDSDTRLVPNRLLNTTLGELTAAQRNALRSNLEEWLTGYSYIDWDNTQVVKAAFSAAGYDGTTPLKRVLLDVFKHLGHTTSRPKVAAFESHNTEYTDNFDSDSSASWTDDSGGYTYVRNATDGELQQSSMDNDARLRYSANTPGSIEHEVQCTVKATTVGRFVLSGVRMYGTGDDAYGTHSSATDTLLTVVRFNAGVRTDMTTHTITQIDASDWATHRFAASGTAGNNVVLDTWWQDHGASKPSDPGWYGTDGSPTFTYTDTSVDRLDDSTHTYGGSAGRGPVSDLGARLDFWKVRAISDRGGAPADPEGSLINGKLINGGLLLHGVLIQ